MNVRNCRNCGRIFNYVAGAPLCQICRAHLEEKFQEVKKYIMEHRGVGIAEVSEACDVERSQIQQWLREERLEVTEDSAIFLNCEKCGAHIRSGKYCERCRVEVSNAFRSVIRQKEAPPTPRNSGDSRESARMRYL